MKMSGEETDHGSMAFSPGMRDESVKKKQKTSSKATRYSDVFAVPNLLEGLDCDKFGREAKEIEDLLTRTGKIQKISSKPLSYADPFSVPDLLGGIDCDKFGSAAKEIEALRDRKMEMQNLDLAMHSALPNMFVDVDKNESKEVSKSPSRQAYHLADRDVIILEDDPVADNFAAAELPVVICVSDDDVSGHLRPSNSGQEVVSVKPSDQCLKKDLVVRDCAESKAPTEEKGSLAGEIEIRKDKGIYIGVEDDVGIEEANKKTDIEDDGLEDIWKEMTIALECSKDVAVDHSSVGHHGEECDHSFVLKDDLGFVCRICGVIQRRIETIIDIQYKVKRTTRTYRRESKDREASEIFPGGVKFSEHELTDGEIYAHPRHRKQMKPHQAEGFNFLVSNLVADNPGGCILAHAPGSGKTFMIISFMQSFLAKYPYARPLVILPKGILPTWKKEFQTWQVEDIPLYDFYSVKAESRSQQLDVLKQWVEHKSILFLGYKQFSSIVCGSGTSNTVTTCQEILLKAPTILILDEGHTPRNKNTAMLSSLAKVQTPRKVVLSGTLYQNHVEEVFNILKLVRPKFFKLDTSRVIKKRIMSRVDIIGVRKQVKTSADSAFFDLVEHTLQKDEDFRRKVAVIQDLREMTSKVLHYYKGDFLDELPGLDDFTVLLNLTARQKPEVDKLKKLGMKFKRSSVGSAVYMHPQLIYFSENIPAAEDKLSFSNDEKLDEMLEELDVREGVKAKFFLNILRLCESAGEKLLVFSQYLLPLKFLERLTVKVKAWSPGKEIFMISGDSNSELREWSMERFNNSPDAKVFFGSIKACGEGISLVGASRIIVLDVHLNPSVTRQAIGRAFRPGQKKKVYTYRLIAADSPEEDDHITCFKKEQISKMWFEWNEYCGLQDFKLETVDVKECGDWFLESPSLRADVKFLYKR